MPAAAPLLFPVLYGRETELAALRGYLAGTRAGQGGLALVSGEAGIGKTTVTAALCHEAAAEGLLVLSGACYDLTTTPPYGPWAEVAAGYPDDPDLPPLPDQFRAGGGMRGIDSQQAFFELTGRFLAAVAEQRPLVIRLEDVHWADTASLELLRYLSRSIAGKRVLLLVTYRDDEITREHPLAQLMPALLREGHVHRLHLSRLDRASIGALVRDRYLLPAADEARLADYLFGLAEGNPLFTRELLFTLVDHRLLRPDGGGWGLDELDEAGVPTLVQQILDTRLARLGSACRAALDIAAVIGHAVRLDLLQELYDGPVTELDDALDQATQHHLLVVLPGNRSLRFSHELVRRAIYAEIAVLRRQELHLRVGEMLVARRTNQPAAIASHFTAAGDPRALDWLIQAAARARELFAPTAVLAACAQAVGLAEQLGLDLPAEFFRLRGWAHDAAGAFETALHDYAQWLERSQRAGDRQHEWQALLDLGALWAARDYQRSGEYTRRAVELARALDDRTALAHSLNRLGNWYLNAEKPDEGLGYHDEALGIFAALGDDEGLASTLDLIGMTRFMAGDAERALGAYAHAIPLLRRLGDRQTLSTALATAALVARGSWPACTLGLQPLPAALGGDAERCEAEAIRIARDIGWRAGEAYAASQHGSTLVPYGAVRAGLALMHDALRIAETIQHVQWLALTHVNLGSAYVHVLLPAHARPHLEEALRYADAAGAPFFRSAAVGLLAIAALQEGRGAEAEQLLRGRIDPVRGPRLKSQSVCWYAFAALLLEQGAPARAFEVVERVLGQVPPGVRELPPAWLRLRGDILLASGRLAEAEATLGQAREIAGRYGLALVSWRVLGSLARVYQVMGRPGEARSLIRQAAAEIDRLAPELDGAAVDLFRRRALAELGLPLPAPEPDQTHGAPAGLTTRELEVLGYLVAGYSDREIAALLFISPRTVGNHVSSILAKLDVPSRTAAAALAVRERLVTS